MLCKESSDRDVYQVLNLLDFLLLSVTAWSLFQADVHHLSVLAFSHNLTHFSLLVLCTPKCKDHPISLDKKNKEVNNPISLSLPPLPTPQKTHQQTQYALTFVSCRNFGAVLLCRAALKNYSKCCNNAT